MDSEARQIVAASEGYCNADGRLRYAIRQADLYGGDAIVDEDGNDLGQVSIHDSESETKYNAENTTCCIAIITPEDGSDAIWVGYYSDGAQHALDVLPAESTVDDWAQGWDEDGLVPEYLRRRYPRAEAD